MASELIRPTRVTGRVTPPAPGGDYSEDATVLTDRTCSWHSDVTIRTDSRVVTGYSKTGGRFGVAEFDASGSLLDSRIIVDEPSLYLRINDHFMVVPWLIQNGTHAGKLWVITLPHGSNAAIAGTAGRRFYCRYSPTGRTANLIAAGGETDFLLAEGNHNYGNIQERASGRICMLTVNDQSDPQSVRFLITDDPAVLPTLCRPITDETGKPPGGASQLYVNAVPGEDADTMRVFSFLHPSVPNAPIKTFLVDLDNGQVRVGGVAQGSGSVFDSSGDVMLTYGDSPAINSVSGGLFTRLHDVCEYGNYQHGYAVAITQGERGSDLDAGSHIVMWCDPNGDIEDSANWQQAEVGAPNRARSWDNGSNRRYNSDIRFLPPRDDEGIRVWLIAYRGVDADYRIEIWAGNAPSAMDLVGTTAWSSSPRPMRLFTNPGADALLGFVYSFVSYTSFTNFIPGAPLAITTENIADRVPWTPENLPAGLVVDVFDPTVDVGLDGSNVTSWSGTVAVYTQGDVADRPTLGTNPDSIVFTPSSHSSGDKFIAGNSTARAFFRARGLVYSMLIARPAVADGNNHAWLHQSVNGAATSARLLIRQEKEDGRWQCAFRRADADAACLVKGDDVVVADTTYIVEALAVYSAGGSTGRLYVNALEQPAPVDEPTSGATTSDTASQVDHVGTDGVGLSNASGRCLAMIRMYGPAGATLSSEDQDRLQGWAAHRFGVASLLPLDHPYKTDVPFND